MIDLWCNKLYLLYSCHFFYLIFPLGCLTSVFEIFRIGKYYWSPILRVLGSLLVILIMLDNSPRRICRDTSIERIISTAEDVGGVGHRVTIRKDEKIAKKY